MTYYDILGVSPDASDEEIKTAYHNLVKAFHPDTYKGDKDFAEEKTQQIVEAYRTLSNETKKAEYDESLAHNSAGAKEENARSSGRRERNAKSAKARRKREKEIFRQIFSIMAIAMVAFMVTTLYFASQYSRAVKKSKMIDERFEAMYGNILNADTGERIDSAEAFLDAVAAERTSKGINGGGVGPLPEGFNEPPADAGALEHDLQSGAAASITNHSAAGDSDKNEAAGESSESIRPDPYESHTDSIATGESPDETSEEQTSGINEPSDTESGTGAEGQLQGPLAQDEEAELEAESE